MSDKTPRQTIDPVTGVAGAFGEHVQKTLSAFNSVSADGSKTLEAFAASANAATKGFETLRAQVVSYSQAAFENHLKAVGQLAGAESAQHAIELQSGFLVSAMESYLASLGHWSETVSATIKNTMQPLNAQVTATVERLQPAR